jgi:fructokinase
MADVVAFGEMLIDFVPTVSGRTLAAADTFKKAAGGAPANVAAGLARLGVSSAFMGMVGDDPFGAFSSRRACRRRCRRFDGEVLLGGANRAGLRVAAGGRRARVPVLPKPERGHADAPGGRRLGDDPRGARLSFRLDQLDRGPLPRQHPARSARARGWAAGDLRSQPQTRAVARRGGCEARHTPRTREADVVKIGDEELAFLTGCNDPVAAARSIWATRTRLIAIPRGKAGCLWLTASAQGAIPGFAVVTVDATDAGDAFTAGLICGLVGTQGIPQNPSEIDQICRFANAVGALTTTGRGAIRSLPARAAVNAFLSEQAQ